MNASDINTLFRAKELTLGSVESFTGGLFASEITQIPHASHFYKGGVVTYATEEKEKILGIPHDIIEKNGVVSKIVAKEMASRGKQLLNVDYCVSFTGNAGPTAMENKPVGEIYIGVAYKNKVEVYPYQWSSLSRKEIQNKAVETAFEILETLIFQQK